MSDYKSRSYKRAVKDSNLRTPLPGSTTQQVAALNLALSTAHKCEDKLFKPRLIGFLLKLFRQLIKLDISYQPILFRTLLLSASCPRCSKLFKAPTRSRTLIINGFADRALAARDAGANISRQIDQERYADNLAARVKGLIMNTRQE